MAAGRAGVWADPSDEDAHIEAEGSEAAAGPALSTYARAETGRRAACTAAASRGSSKVAAASGVARVLSLACHPPARTHTAR